MTDIAADNRRIMKNTVFLYLRMLMTTFVGLFTSRVILDALGIIDYGIYNLVSGIIVLFSFLNSSLTSATQRFLNFFLGKKDYKMANKVFCLSINLFFFLFLLVLVLGETVGLWFVNTQLYIPAERMHATIWVYQFTLLQFIINLFNIPYTASIIANEKMNFFAYTSLVYAIVKLVLVYLLYITNIDKLVFLSFLYTTLSFVILCIYILYCNHHFNITHYRFILERGLFKELLSFSGWNLFGSIANLVAQQGLNVLFNLFHGVTVNATMGVVNQVIAHVYGFVSNFQIAFQPQIVKKYAAGERKNLYNLLCQTSKFSYYLLIIIGLPIIFTIDGILDIWLVDIPPYAAIFCRLVFIFSAIDAINAPLWMLIQATGNIRNYQILISVIILLNFPIAYILLKLGYPPYSVWYGRIVVNLIAMIIRLIYIRYSILYTLKLYIVKVLLPIIYVTLLALPIPFVLCIIISDFWANLVIVIFVSFLITILDIYYIGMNKHERDVVKFVIESKLHFRNAS